MKERLEWKNQTLKFSVNYVLSAKIDQKSISYSTAYFHKMHFQIQRVGCWIGLEIDWGIVSSG